MRGDEKLHALQTAAEHARSAPEHGQGEQQELVGREECAPVCAQQHHEAVREADTPAPPHAREGALGPFLERFLSLQARLLNLFLKTYSYMHFFLFQAQIRIWRTRTEKFVSIHTHTHKHY